jgi:hypothetical protein
MAFGIFGVAGGRRPAKCTHNTQTRRPADAFNRLFPDASNTQFFGDLSTQKSRRGAQKSSSDCFVVIFPTCFALKRINKNKIKFGGGDM